MTRTLTRWLFPPLMLLGFNGAAIALIVGRAPHLLLVVLLVAAIALSFAVERLIPYEPAWNDGQDDVGRDVAHAFVNETFALASVLALPALAGFATLADAWPSELPFVVQEVLGSTVGQLVLVDVTIAITVCALALQAWAARTLFAMGRDAELPGAGFLSRVSKERSASGLPIS